MPDGESPPVRMVFKGKDMESLTLLMLGVLFAVLGFIWAVFCCIHALLHKKDSQSALAWVACILLLPFVGCAAAVYLAFLFLSKDVTHKAARCALLLVPLALWGGGIAAWCGMNYKYYGRFIVSDFTSSEFEDAMGALSRACPDDQKRYEVLPLSTPRYTFPV